MRASEQIRAEIEERFGFFPPFFEPALASPLVLDNLWQQTLAAYIENPLSALFKEKLNALLSRFCTAPYCLVVHSAALRPLGMTAQGVLALLEAPPFEADSDKLPLGVLPVPTSAEAAAPVPGSPLERTLLSCATAVFLERADAEACLAELHRLLGPDLYPHLVAYLAYIKTCHVWIEAHPAISYEADSRALKNLGPLLAEEPALEGFFRHYQERFGEVRESHVTEAVVAAERTRSDKAVRDSEEKLRLLVDGAKDYAMILMDAHGRVTNWNAGAERILGWTEGEVLGRPGDLIFTPEDRVAEMPMQEMQRAVAQGRSMDLRWHQKQDGTRFWADGIMECLRDGDGGLRGFAKILRDATDQKLSENARRHIDEERQQAREELREVNQRLAGILESITDAFFALDPDWRFTYLNDQAERLLFRTRVGLMGKSVWDEFPQSIGTPFEQEYRRAVTEQAAVTFEAFYPPLGTWFEVRAYPSTDGLSVYFHDIDDRKALEAEQARLSDANRLLLESTGEGIYGIDAQGRFTFVNRAAASMLGYSQDEMLGRNGHTLIHHSHPDGTSYPEADCPIYQAMRLKQGGHREDDVFWRRDGTAFPVAYSAAPILEDGVTRGAVVTFSDISERKTLEAARARVAERERNIASQLQQALQPELPGAVPGLSLKKYYEAALTDEAGVGGDFYDVFAIDKGCTALVVGDLSGKGLQAAAQVATVRNMLRAFLYSKSTVAEAVTNLNRILAENNLLTGFSTLFVGAYESGTRVLNYVNAGQEPALIRRARTGTVEALMPTGPILGTLEDAQYAEESVTLAPGDALAIFTDGLTEVGNSRLEMLGIEGVTALWERADIAGKARDPEDLAEHLTLCLIDGVDAAAAGGVMRDDVCLLVAVVE